MGLIFRPKSIWGTSGQHGDVCAAFQRIYLSTRSFTWGSKCPPDGSRISTLSGDSLTCLTRELSVPVYPLTQFEPSWSLFLTVLVETLKCPICTTPSWVKVRVLPQSCCLSASCGALAWTLTISSCLLTKNGNTVPQVWLTLSFRVVPTTTTQSQCFATSTEISRLSLSSSAFFFYFLRKKKEKKNYPNSIWLLYISLLVVTQP